MKKLLTILLSVILAANFLSCGGGGAGSNGSSTVTTGKTNVTINLGETQTLSKTRVLKSASLIPAAIVNIKFTISAPDMATIIRVITLVGGSAISETFEVPSGPNRHFVVEAMDADGNVLFKGDLYADLTGASANLTIAMISVEEIAPVFSGLLNIDSITTTSMVLSWPAATDNVTPPDRIQYLINISTTPGGQDFTSPNFVTIPGATAFTLTGLNPNTTYYIVVRAKDERGNVDVNSVEKSATTLMPPDTTAPAFAGIISASALSETAIGLSWNPASDDRTAASDITYLIYMATSSYGQNPAIPSFTIKGTTSLTVTGLSPGTTYYFIVRAKDGAGNIDGNIVEKSATTLDTTAPAFAGILSASALSETEIELSWNPASDNLTAASNIIYLIYMATSSHGQNPAIPSFTIKGTTSFTVTGLSPGTTYYFIVRAKDGAGNIDGNIVEKSATTLITQLADLQPGNIQFDSLYSILSGFRINNFGNVGASNVYYIVLTGGFSGFTNCSGNTVPSIPAGSFTNISIGNIYATDYYILIDPNNTVPESNEGNNSACSGVFCIAPPTPNEISSACY